MPSALSLNHVRKAYKDFTLNDISFTLPSGSIMGFIGENGAGKTTTIKLILNLITRDSGSISVFGMDNIHNERAIKKQLGIVFDECCFHPVLTPNNIGKIMESCYAQWDEKLYSHYLRQWMIPPTKTVKNLSKGMKTKLSIAAALSHHPKLLILDEATGGLDPVVRGDVLDTFQEFIEDEEHSILFSSHITSDLDRIADYVTFLHEGSILLCEDKETLLDTYGIVKCSEEQMKKLPTHYVAGVRRSDFGCEALIRNIAAVRRAFPGLVVDKVKLEDIMTLIIRGNQV